MQQPGSAEGEIGLPYCEGTGHLLPRGEGLHGAAGWMAVEYERMIIERMIFVHVHMVDK